MKPSGWFAVLLAVLCGAAAAQTTVEEVRRQWPDCLVRSQQRPPLGDVEREIRLETPGVEADGHVVSQEIGGREIEIDQSRQVMVQKEHVVGKQIRVNVPLRQ